MRFSLFRKTAHQTFTHIPIYYDEGEERIKNAEDNAKVERGEKRDSNYKDTIKGSMRRFAHQHQSAAAFARNEKKRSNVRIVVILSILFAVAYLLLAHTETFIEAFMKR
jgi:hypothetical protein